MNAFADAYQKLNTAQKKAIDTVEGPVLVIAGPGTGKTHILTLRVANILKQTDTKPENILVLTFTDSAARTVSHRIKNLIGEETGRKVGVYTFHSFAEVVLKTYPEAFPLYTDRRLMGEVEQTLVWRDVLEKEKPTLLATPKSPFHYLKDLRSLEDDMTRERLTLEAYEDWLTQEEKQTQSDPALRYIRGEKAGTLNPKGLAKMERVEKGREAARLIRAYREEKETRGVYGYTDVLRIVVDALAHDESLCADLQEQYQYVLADEHQDANALQHALLDALAFDEHPNLFIVGDEKQAVFGFQGADVTHFKTFLTLYPRTEVITLTDNYRSYQDLLDLSHTLLKDLPASSGEHVRLNAYNGKGGHMHLLQAPDALAERDQVATLVAKAIAEGVPPHEIAVITLKNNTADLFALHLRARGINTLRAGDIDFSGRPSIRFLLSLMHAVADVHNTAALRDALLAPWWKESLALRTRVLRTSRDSELLVTLETACPDLYSIITTLQHQAQEMPPVSLFSRLLVDTGARAYFLSEGEHLAEDVPLARQLVMHIEELVRLAPNATFSEVMETFTKVQEHDIGSIKTALTSREGYVTVITAHKAKGMEFERVFVTALTKREWEGRGKSTLIPSPFDTAREKEELVRLLYVACTRAKSELTLSYAIATGEGKENEPISLMPEGLSSISVPTNPLPVLHHTYDAPALVRELTEHYLTHDGLSPSAYNEYLASPATFFARRVLRLSEPETRAIVVGNAVHAGIAAFLRLEEERAAGAHTALERSVQRSLLPRGDTFDALARHAHACLDVAIASPLLAQEAPAIEESFQMEKQVGEHTIILKGKVDAVFRTESGECIVDFKTSSTVDTKDKEKFERQLAFYDLLLRANGHDTTSALIMQIGEEKVTEHTVALTAQTRATLAHTLEEVLHELLSGHWRAGEQSEYDDLLNLFTATPDQ